MTGGMNRAGVTLSVCRVTEKTAVRAPRERTAESWARREHVRVEDRQW